MASASASFEKIVALEGGFVNHKNDPGGATNYGVSLRFLLQSGYDLDLDGDGDTDIDDIKKMTHDDAFRVFKKYFWLSSYDQLHQAIADQIADMAYLCGAGRAHRIVQEALNLVGFTCVVDGKFGPVTVNLIKSAPPVTLLFCTKAVMLYYLMGLVDKNSKLESFRSGWINRVWHGAQHV